MYDHDIVVVSLLAQYGEMSVQKINVCNFFFVQDLGMEDKPAPTLPPPFQPYQQTSPGNRSMRDDPNSSASSDPFSDDFFQKAFDTPSAQVVGRPADFAGFNLNFGTPAQLTSTPEGQAQPQHNQPSLAELSHEFPATVNPFTPEHGGFVDPFQGSFGTIGQPGFTPAFAEPLNSHPQQQGLSFASPSSYSQPSMQPSPFFSPTPQPLSFSSNDSVSPSVVPSTGGYSSGLSAGNPFAADFDSSSFPFGVGSFTSPNAGSFTAPLIHQSASSSSFRSDGSDPFADLLSLPLVPTKAPLAEREETKPPAEKSTPAPPRPSTRKTQQKWDTFQSPERKAQEPALEPMPLEGNIFDAFEDGFHKREDHQTAVSSGFDDSFREGPTERGAGIGPNVSSSPSSSNGQTNTRPSTNGGFGDGLHDSAFPKPDKQFSGAPNHQQREGTGTTPFTADHGFDDYFVLPSDGKLNTSEVDQGKSWVSFS